MSEKSKTFCVLPWTHLATYTSGSVLLCCVARDDLNLNLNEVSLAQAWNSQQLKDVRLKMLRGEKVSSCTSCYREENVGYLSHRVTENKAWRERFGADFIQQRIDRTAADGSLDEGLVAVDLRLGNTCNLTCVMCRPHDSSKWGGLAKKLEKNLRDEDLFNEWREKSAINQSRFEWYKRKEFWDDFDQVLPSIRELIIGGGEPMLLAEHKVLIDKCVKSGHASHIQLRYHTNGTILDEDIFEYWKDFKLVEVFISLDSIGERNHYMRHPADWKTIEKNIQKIDSYPHGNLRSLLLCSVHLMSAFYLADYAKWVESQNFKIISVGFEGYFHPGVVHFPNYLSVQALPQAAKKFITEKVREFEEKSKNKNSKIEGILSFMNEADKTELLPKTREYIRSLDVARGTNFSEALPELHEYLEM